MPPFDLTRLVHVLAPTSKLGIRPEGSLSIKAAYVRKIEEGSLVGKMWLEDRVVAMDDADGRDMAVAEISTLLTSKSNRKITVLRERVHKLT